MGAPTLRGIRNSLQLFLVFCFTDASAANFRIKAEERKQLLEFNKEFRGGSKATENIDVFSPKMDYDEWTPLGQGDPLKNDPTYDYVPPVLDKVHYWIDPEKRTPDPLLPNSSLLLFAPEKESSPSQHGIHQRLKEANSRFDTSSLYPLLKFLATPQSGENVSSGPFNFRKPSPSKGQHHHLHNKSPVQKPPQALQRPPHTMLMPPPLFTTVVQNVNSPVATTHSANYETKNQTTDAIFLHDSLISATTEVVATNEPAAIANTENVFRPVAILMPDQIKMKEKETEVLHIAYRPTKKTIKEEIEAFTSVPAKTQFPLDVPKMKQQETEKYSNKPANDPSRTQETNKILVDFESNTASEPEEIQNVSINPQKNNQNANLFQGSAASTTTVRPFSSTFASQRYKQSANSPFYLIIEGHSKVKTYGAGKNSINQLITSNAIGCDDKTREKRNRLEENWFYDNKDSTV